MTRILAFAGSARSASLNKKLARAAGDLAQELGAGVTHVDLADFPIPLYHGDLESDEGIPAKAQELRHLLSEHDALIIACPEYNGSITPLLKNVIDWTSRPADGQPPSAVWRGKTAALLSASPGGFGGMRGLVHVRAILSGIGVLVIPGDVSVPKAYEAFHDDGSLADERVAKRLQATVGNLVRIADALLSAPA